jgi:hypothetical protein
MFLDDKYAPYVGELNAFDESLKARIAAVAEESQSFPADEFLAAVNDYIGTLKAHGYGNTSLMTAKHALTVLYLFLDIHALGYHSEIGSAWFSGVAPFLPKNWKHWRRLVYLFSEYCENALPMPVSVGNAIYRYIKEGRPKVHSDYVFIRHTAPYGKITNKTCTIALWSILPERKDVHGGFHVTRRTFATNILRTGAGASDVMDTLGHTDPTSVMKYLSMDEERMRQCPLSLSDLPLTREGV